MAAAKTKKPSKSPSKQLKAGKKKLINKWIIVGGVVAVAVIGALVYRLSEASSRYKFTHTRGQFYCRFESTQPGKYSFNFNKRAYAPFSCQQSGISTRLSASELSRSTSLCTHVANTTKYSAFFTVSQVKSTPGVWKTASSKALTLKPRSTGYVCTAKRDVTANVVYVDGYALGAPSLFRANVGIDTIYGK